MKRIAALIGAGALSALVAAAPTLAGDVEKNVKTIRKGETKIKIVTVTEDGETTVRAYVDGKEVDPATLEKGDLEWTQKQSGGILFRADEEAEYHTKAPKKKADGKGKMKVVIDGETFEIDLSRMRGLLEEHGAKLEEQLSHLERIELPQLGKHAEGLVGNYFQFDPQTKEYTVSVAPVAPPKVMIGITMDDVGPALAKHLKLDPKAVTMIESVLEGQPADKAGLQAYDIVVAADGNSPMTSEHLLKVLRKKEPGQNLTLRIIRGGEPTTAVVELAPWSEEAMAKLRRAEEIELQGMDVEFFPGEAPSQFSKEIQEKLKQAMGQEKEVIIELQKQAQEQAKKAHEMAKKVEEQTKRLRLSPPKPPKWVEAEKAEDNEQLEQRLERLEDRLARIEKMLEKLVN